MMIVVNADIAPVAQPRQRFRSGKVFSRKKGGMVTIPVAIGNSAHPVNVYKNHLATSIRAARPEGWKLDLPIRFHAIYVFQRPKSFGSGPRMAYTPKPDLDNLCKSVKDCLKGILWKDDNQVVWMSCEKFYAASDEVPSAELRFCQAESEWFKLLIPEYI